MPRFVRFAASGFKNAKRTPRLFYSAGPGDVLGTFHHWLSGQEDPAQTHVTYSSQFFDLCRELGAPGLVVSYHAKRGKYQAERLIVEHLPIPYRARSGLLWHFGQVLYGLMLLVRAVRFRADIAILSEGTHWFMLGLFRLFGIHVVPNLLCVLHTKYRTPSRINRILLRMARPIFRSRALAILSMSHDITRQIRAITGPAHRPILEFLPLYRRELFAQITPPPADRQPFRVFYAGRVERDKGVFDLLQIASELREAGRHDIEFDLCGGGSALADLQAQARAQGLETTFRCHGHAQHQLMQRMLSGSHVVIVPTRTAFVEGFNQVIAEAICAGRPVISSPVCPALEYVQPASEQARPDDVDSYKQALLRLADNPAHYQNLQSACANLSGMFFNPAKSWQSAVRKAVSLWQK